MGAKTRVEEAIRLYESGFIPLALRKDSKHLNLEAMGYNPLHFQTKSQKLKELAFASVCYQLSQVPPDKATVAGWFADPAQNIGILGGHNGLLVLDFDRPKVFDAWYAHYGARLGACPIARSPNGHHVFLRSTRPFETSSLYFGRRKAGHLKSLGGYVVAPPSELSENKCYAWRQECGPPAAPLPEIAGLSELGLASISPLKAFHDRLRGRGSFVVQ